MAEFTGKDFASHGVGSAALATGIIGTTLGVLNGGLGGLFGGCGKGHGYGHGHGECGHGHGGGNIDRWDYCNLEKSSEKDAIIATLKSEKYTDLAVAKVTDKFERKIDYLAEKTNSTFDCMASKFENKIDNLAASTNARFWQVEHCIGNQNVVNAQLQGIVSCQAKQIECLESLTKLIVPASSICPTPMPLFNSFTVPTTTVSGTAAGLGLAAGVVTGA